LSLYFSRGGHGAGRGLILASVMLLLGVAALYGWLVYSPDHYRLSTISDPGTAMLTFDLARLQATEQYTILGRANMTGSAEPQVRVVVWSLREGEITATLAQHSLRQSGNKGQQLHRGVGLSP